MGAVNNNSPSRVSANTDATPSATPQHGAVLPPHQELLEAGRQNQTANAWMDVKKCCRRCKTSMSLTNCSDATEGGEAPTVTDSFQEKRIKMEQ